MNIKIIVATHTKFSMPDCDCYLPVHVGSLGKEPIGYQEDHTGDTISQKNPTCCELTGMYWAWKNLEADYYGLVHYRRHFCGQNRSKNKFDNIIQQKELETYLADFDIICPKKRNYYIESVYSHYIHTHYQKDIDEARKVLSELQPDYLAAFDKQMKSRKAHMFNMLVMKKDKFHEYCGWLFPILFELEGRIDISGYTPFEARVFGRISELLLDVWITKNEYACCELPLLYLEKINWRKKGIAFLKAKFLRKKYKESF